MSETIRVEVYSGYEDTVRGRSPIWDAEVEVYDGDSYQLTRKGPPRSIPHDADVAHLSKEIEFASGSIDIWAESDVPIYLYVHTNDSYHNPEDWNRPVEGGLRYGPDMPETMNPFGCEVWGRVGIWAGPRESTDE